MNKKVAVGNKRIIASTHVKLGQKNKKGQTYTDPHRFFFETPGTANFLTGSEVIREAIRRASIDMSVAYPITPQSEAAALIGELYAEGYMGDYFRGESE
ncbi:MAG: ferredoxin oxidoreductase, partial [Nitrospinae bacterium]|nr:ferredoxin oxidoreductase [Nitrospinota bacterium]